MHRTLKAATARPPSANLRRQQEAFDDFREEYNEQRPHEALQMRIPGEVYQPSCRAYPGRFAEPKYENGWEVRLVRECGRIRWWSKSMFIGKALCGEWIALEPQEDGQWTVWFFDYPIGVMDERKRRITKRTTLTEAQSVARADGAPERRA